MKGSGMDLSERLIPEHLKPVNHPSPFTRNAMNITYPADSTHLDTLPWLC